MQIHPLHIAPTLSGDQYFHLRNEISRSGLIMPLLTVDDMIVDGRARAKACRELGIEIGPHMRRNLTEHEDPLRWSVMCNRPRITTLTQRVATARMGLLVDPNRSNRNLASIIKLSADTVCKIRAQLIKEGLLPESATRAREYRYSVKRPVTQRIEEIKTLYASGMNTQQVAAAIGSRATYITEVLKNHGIEVPKSAHLKGRGTMQSGKRIAKVMEETVNALVGIAQGLNLIIGHTPDMSAEEATALLRDARPSLKTINKAIAKLREVANG